MNDSETCKSNDRGESQATKAPLDAWYYLVGDKTCGPNTAEEIRNQIASGAIPDGTFVFREGMGDWAKARTLKQFQLSSARDVKECGNSRSTRSKLLSLLKSDLHCPKLSLKQLRCNAVK